MKILRYLPKAIASPIRFAIRVWKFVKRVRRWFRPKKPSRYTSDWPSVSRRYKESRGWTCEECSLSLRKPGDQHLLHVHHKNRDSLDNRESNLVALCVQCHSKQPGVGHKRLRTAAMNDGRWERIDRMRGKRWLPW